MKKLIILLIFSAASANGQSVTGVVGTVSDGSNITIAGSSFGAKETAAPVIWDNFNSGEIGASVASGGIWGTAGTAPVYSETNQRVSGDNNMYCHLEGLNDFAYANNLAVSDTLYVNFWYLVHEAPESQYQIKLWGIAQLFNETAYPAFVNFLWQYSGGTKGRYFQIYGSAYPSNLYTPWPTPDTWQNEAVEIIVGSTAENSAHVKHFENCSVTINSSCTLKALETDVYDSFKFGYYLGNGGSATYTQFDNIYIDKTLSRVELGDNSVFSSCTHREIQVPYSWSATSIGVTVNQGTFAAGETAYLFVVDADGSVSDQNAEVAGDQGYPVTIGGTASSSLTAPSNLRQHKGN